MPPAITNYEVRYSDHGTAILLEADLDRGWRRLKKTYGFNASKKIYYKHGWSIRAQLTLIAQPASFEIRAAVFPNGSCDKRQDPLISYQLKDRKLAVKIGLVAEHPWREMSTGRPGLFIEELPFLSFDQTLWVDLRVWIVFHRPSPAPVKDVREWGQRMFVPGGQFESNRQKH